jgi:hypothetical protein
VIAEHERTNGEQQQVIASLVSRLEAVEQQLAAASGGTNR